MNKLKKITAFFLMLLTVLNQHIFAKNIVSKMVKVACIAANSTVLTASSYVVAIRQIMKKNVNYVSKQKELTHEVLIKCDDIEKVFKTNKFLFTKNEIETIKELLDRKDCDLKLLCTKDERTRISKQIAKLFVVLAKYKNNHDAENAKLCEEEIQRLSEEYNKLLPIYNQEHPF